MCESSKHEVGLAYEEVRKYIKYGGRFCPWCGERDKLYKAYPEPAFSELVGEAPQITSFVRDVRCNSCEKEWQECFSLSDIDYKEEDDLDLEG